MKRKRPPRLERGFPGGDDVASPSNAKRAKLKSTPDLSGAFRRSQPVADPFSPNQPADVAPIRPLKAARKSPQSKTRAPPKPDPENNSAEAEDSDGWSSDSEALKSWVGKRPKPDSSPPAPPRPPPDLGDQKSRDGDETAGHPENESGEQISTELRHIQKLLNQVTEKHGEMLQDRRDDAEMKTVTIMSLESSLKRGQADVEKLRKDLKEEGDARVNAQTALLEARARIATLDKQVQDGKDDVERAERICAKEDALSLLDHDELTRLQTELQTALLRVATAIDKSDDVPSRLKCPISHELMRDPVMAADGHTYERKSIKEWLEGNETSPLTNEKLTNKNLIPNHGIREEVQHYNKDSND